MIATRKGFMLVCIGLTLLTTALLALGLVDQGVWSGTIMFVWGAQVAGGVGAYAANKWAEVRNGKPVA